jgi:hypothetical protein
LCKDITSPFPGAVIVQTADFTEVSVRRRAEGGRAAPAKVLERAASGTMKVRGSGDFSNPGGSRKASIRATFVNVKNAPRRNFCTTKLSVGKLDYEAKVAA